ncbi:membrane protein FxsA [Mycolicibacterium cosmeticum]|uniref:FxsA protein n=1 Tax=Mycolicibacterium cosmeticum TaxID=258533 RepID=W9ASN8_MYCCO|nr:FxsA family protein [Mycolicibacterium cosmeticum]TLH73327.1 membrane protein FxsA [Mycolicibacterium cosmeticum]CDO08804.1 FxsA protein [Mycolicibacterium cosmeticum]
MASRLFLVYVLVELAVVVGLISTIGFGWTVLALLAAFGIGLALAGAQLTRQLARLRGAVNSRSGDPSLATDSLLVALGTVLVVIPGLASSVVGALLLLPPTRVAARPLATRLVNRQLNRAVPVMVFSSTTTTTRGRGDYVDGEVIDVVDEVVTPAPLPPRQD